MADPDRGKMVDSDAELGAAFAILSKVVAAAEEMALEIRAIFAAGSLSPPPLAPNSPAVVAGIENQANGSRPRNVPGPAIKV